MSKLKEYLEELERQGLIRKPYDLKIGPVSEDNKVQVTVTKRARIYKISINVIYEGEKE